MMTRTPRHQRRESPQENPEPKRKSQIQGAHSTGQEPVGYELRTANCKMTRKITSFTMRGVEIPMEDTE